jgi:radical SAM protein with 4Fe4S-binding SPASM domain
MPVSPVRNVNAVRIACSFLHSSLTHIPLISGMPPALSAELTNTCNLQCPECASGSGISVRKKGFMDPELYMKVIAELRPYLYNVNLYFQGEPMMHPRFFDFIAMTGDVHSVVSTNGHFLSDGVSEKLALSGLKKLIISLDGMDQDTYSNYRKGGDFSMVIAGIRNIAGSISRTGSHLKLEIQFLVNKYNEHQINDIRKLASNVGASLKLKSMQIIDIRRSGEWMPVERRYRRYVKADGDYKIKSRLPDRCMRLWFNPVITWDGKVLPCCFDKDAEFIMGDMNNDTFHNIWNGQEYKKFRIGVLTGRSNIGICRNCTSGLRGVLY